MKKEEIQKPAELMSTSTTKKECLVIKPEMNLKI